MKKYKFCLLFFLLLTFSFNLSAANFSRYFFFSIYKAGVVNKEKIKVVLPYPVNRLIFKVRESNHPVSKAVITVISGNLEISPVTALTNKKGEALFSVVNFSKGKTKILKSFSVNLNLKENLPFLERLDSFRKFFIYFGFQLTQKQFSDFKENLEKFCLSQENSQIEKLLRKLDFYLLTLDTFKKKIDELELNLKSQEDFINLFFQKIFLVYDSLFDLWKSNPFWKRKEIDLNQFWQKEKILEKKVAELTYLWWFQLKFLQIDVFSTKDPFPSFFHYQILKQLLEKITLKINQISNSNDKSVIVEAYKAVYKEVLAQFLKRMYYFYQKKEYHKIDKISRKLLSFSKRLFYRSNPDDNQIISYVKELYNQINEKNYLLYLDDYASFYQKLSKVLISLLKDFPIEVGISRTKSFFEFFSSSFSWYEVKKYSYELKLKNKFFFNTKIIPLFHSQLEKTVLALKQKKYFDEYNVFILKCNLLELLRLVSFNFSCLSEKEKRIVLAYYSSLNDLFTQDLLILSRYLTGNQVSYQKLLSQYIALKDLLPSVFELIVQLGLNNVPSFFLFKSQSEGNKLLYASYFFFKNNNYNLTLGDELFLKTGELTLPSSFTLFFLPYYQFCEKKVTKLKSDNDLWGNQIFLKNKGYFYFRRDKFRLLKGKLVVFLDGKKIPFSINLKRNRLQIENISSNWHKIQIVLFSSSRKEILFKSENKELKEENILSADKIFVLRVFFIFALLIVLYILQRNKIIEYFFRNFSNLGYAFFKERENILFRKLGNLVYIYYWNNYLEIKEPRILSLVEELKEERERLIRLDEQIEELINEYSNKDKVEFREVYQLIDQLEREREEREKTIAKLYIKLGKKSFGKLYHRLSNFSKLQPILKEIEEWHKWKKKFIRI